MPEDDKSGKAPDSGQPNPQLSEAELEKLVGKALDARIPGLMSGFQKQVTQALESRDDAANDDEEERPYTKLGPRERALKRQQEELAQGQLTLAKTKIAVELGVDEGELTGGNETEMRLSGALYLLKQGRATQASEEETKVVEKRANDPAPTGSPPPGGGSDLSPTEKITQGLKTKPLPKS